MSKEESVSRESVLQDFVVPVCKVRIGKANAHAVALFGTAFFVNAGGIFLTAAHVLRSALGEKREPGFGIGLIVKDTVDPRKSGFVPIDTVEYAPKPYDAGLGVVNYKSRSWFRLYQGVEVTHWKDVATFGYPETALNVDVEKFNIHLRSFKGYVQRRVDPDEIPTHKPHPEAFELNFAIPAGMSGSPLFSADIPDRQSLLGICVASVRAELVEYAEIRVASERERYEEKQLRVEQYGIAHSLLSLRDWKPDLLKGKTLGTAIIETG